MPRNHSIRRVVAAVFDTVWMIEETKLRSMLDLLELRSAGGEYSEDEIVARIGGKQQVGPPEPVNDGGVAILPMQGVMAPRMTMMMDISGGTSTQKFGQWLDDALADPAVKAIVIDANSPGGSAQGNEELASKIRAARGTKPIVGVATGIAASACYYNLAQCDYIVGSPSSEFGSIGTMVVHGEASRANDAAGEKYTVLRAGDQKNLANEYEPLSESGRKDIQDRLDAFNAQFIAAVAAGRKVTAEHVNQNYGRGKVFIASEALSRGMIDRIGTLEQVVAELKQQTKSKPIGATRQAATTATTGVKNMDATIKAVLQEAGLIDANASDAEAQVAFNAFFKGRGETPPESKLAQLAAIAGHKNSSSAPAKEETITQIAPAVDAAEVLRLVSLAGIDDMQFAQEVIGAKDASGKPLSYKGIVEKIQDKKASAAPAAGATVVRVKAEERDKFHAAARDALLIRAHGSVGKDREAAAGATGDYRLTNLTSLAERCLEVAGVDRSITSRLSPTDRARLVMDPRSAASTIGNYGIFADAGGPLYNASGMYASVMLDVANNSMRMGYENVFATYQIWTRRAPDLPDFRPAYATVVGELADPKAIPENGVFVQTEMQDEHESYKLVVWGDRFDVSWQAIVNDQIGAFTTIPLRQGRSMKRKENKLVYAVLKDNAALVDTGALFNSTAQTTAGGHANLTTGAGAPSVSTLNSLTQKMREIKGLVGSDNTDAVGLNLEPKYLLAPPALEGTVRNLLFSYADPASSNANSKNIWEGRLQPVFDYELGTAGGGRDTAWYLAADANDVDTVIYATMAGFDAPRLEEQDSFDRLGKSYRMYKPFVAKAIDYRGLQKHNGE